VAKKTIEKNVFYKVLESDAARAEDRNEAGVTFCLQLFTRL